MCFPNQKCYVIIEPAPQEQAGTTGRADRVPWYARLWKSVQQANQQVPAKAGHAKGRAGHGHGQAASARPLELTGAGWALVSLDAADLAAVARQLGRTPRGARAVAHRCPCGLPDVIETAPRLPDGTPFPTLYYLTCVRACAAASRLEAAGVMREMTERLRSDQQLREAYLAAHLDYAARRGGCRRSVRRRAAGRRTRNRRRHARPGQVPARPGGARACGAWREPARTGGIGRYGRVVGGRAVCRRSGREALAED